MSKVIDSPFRLTFDAVFFDRSLRHQSDVFAGAGGLPSFLLSRFRSKLKSKRVSSMSTGEVRGCCLEV